MNTYLSGFHHLLPHSSILKPLCSSSKTDAISEMFREITLLQSLDRLHSLKEAVLHREEEGSTGLGHGVAIAHGKVSSLTDVYLFLGVSSPGISYGSYDGEPVHLMFIAANPPSMQAVYLEILARLSRYLIHPDARRRLLSCEGHILREILRSVLGCSGTLLQSA